MRNTAESQRDVWAAFAKKWREEARLTKVDLARQLGAALGGTIDRNTVGRWEGAKNLPGSGSVVEAFCRVTGAPRGDALRAAGIVAGEEPEVPIVASEPALDLIRNSSLPAYLKTELLEELASQSAEDMERRRRWAEKLLKSTQRTGLNKPDAPR